MEQKKQIKISLTKAIIIKIACYILFLIIVSFVGRIVFIKINLNNIAKEAYIYTNNNEVNKVFNQMLNSIVKKHSIHINNNEGSLEVMDFVSATSMYGSYNNKNSYISYMDCKIYNPVGMIHEYKYDNYYVPSSKMLYDIAKKYEWYILLGLSNHDKNPYYAKNNPSPNINGYSCNLKEDDIYYIINLDLPNEGTDTYYINKNSFLIEKSEFKHKDRNNTYFYNYSNDIVTIPKEILKKADSPVPIAKPIIYLYPTTDMNVSVKLGNKDKITCSYPDYKDGWKVLAKTDGNLIDLNTKRNLYSLYYESEAVNNFKIEEDGFIVKSSDVSKFLEDKLEVLGLTEREAEEFIVYWLPKLQKNPYNYIRFATKEEINENMPLEINPKPDSLIRVLMTFKGLKNPINIKEQQLETPERKGFVAVEWGGSEIK